jgi:negative regulator of flagellin synthesis FlgM
MNVNSLLDKSVTPATAGSAKPVDRVVVPAQNTATAPQESSNGVEVRLSAVTQTMTNNVARSGTDVFNVEKVEAMRAAIQNGSFSVNAEAVADKLISNAREMMSVASAGPSGGGHNAMR